MRRNLFPEKDLKFFGKIPFLFLRASGITVSDLNNLDADVQAIGQVWSSINNQSLWAVTSELANAVAGGESTAQAQSDFDALFAGTGVSQTVIDQTFSDMTRSIQDSGVTATDLATVAADRAGANGAVLEVGVHIASFEISAGKASQAVNLNGQSDVSVPDADWGPMVFSEEVSLNPGNNGDTANTVTTTSNVNSTASASGSTGTTSDSNSTAAIGTTSKIKVKVKDAHKAAAKIEHTIKIHHSKERGRAQDRDARAHDKHSTK